MCVFEFYKDKYNIINFKGRNIISKLLRGIHEISPF